MVLKGSILCDGVWLSPSHNGWKSFNVLVNSCQVVQSDFLEEMAQNPKGGRSIVTPKSGKATVSVDTHNVVEITIGTVRRYRDDGRFRSLLHCVDRGGVLHQRQSSDGGRGLNHPTMSDRTMLNYCGR